MLLSVTGKGGAIPVQAWIYFEGSRRLRIPSFTDRRRFEVAMLLAQSTAPPPPRPSREDTWHSFLLVTASEGSVSERCHQIYHRK
jgi:hypothetical protein